LNHSDGEAVLSEPQAARISVPVGMEATGCPADYREAAFRQVERAALRGVMPRFSTLAG
jgi:hypothetical protein